MGDQDTSLKIYLAGPMTSYYAAQLNSFGLSQVVLGLPADDAVGPMLVITEPRAWWIDWHYFLSFREIFPASLLRLGCLQLNHGQSLVDLNWPTLDLVALEVLPANYREGIGAAGIYYFPQHLALTWAQRETANAKIIPTPLRWPKMTLANEAPVPAALQSYAPMASDGEGTFAQRLLLLDRDGVINEDGHYPARPQDIHLRPAIFPVLRYAQARGIPCIVLSNQSGIARGKFTMQDLKDVTQYMIEQLRREGIAIAGWYHCPFYAADQSKADAAGEGLPEELAPYQVHSLWRKPFPAMALQAAADFDGDLRNSVMIGDKLSDALYFAGHNFWLQTSAEYITSEMAPRSYGHVQIFAQENDLLMALQKLWP